MTQRVFICQNTNTMLLYNTTHCRRAAKKAIAYERWLPIETISNQWYNIQWKKEKKKEKCKSQFQTIWL